MPPDPTFQPLLSRPDTVSECFPQMPHHLVHGLTGPRFASKVFPTRTSEKKFWHLGTSSDSPVRINFDPTSPVLTRRSVYDNVARPPTPTENRVPRHLSHPGFFILQFRPYCHTLVTPLGVTKVPTYYLYYTHLSHVTPIYYRNILKKEGVIKSTYIFIYIYNM